MATDDIEITTVAGIPVSPLYGPTSHPVDPEAVGEPGKFPFTRGNFETGYRGKKWTIRQYSGFGTADMTNERFKLLLGSGATGLSVALDLPTQIGFDSDDPEVEEEVGRVGVALDSLADAETMFSGIPLDQVSTSWTINGSAAIMLAFYAAVARKQGVPLDRLRGTIQNDILKEYVARGTWIWPPEPSIRLIVDTIEFCAENMPRYNAISVAGAHFRDAGATAIQELAFTLSDAVSYVDAVLARGRMNIDDFAPQISFFFYTHNDFFEEIAKYRAGRRRWAHLVKERWGAERESSCMFRAGCVAGGSTLQALQPRNNAIRVAYQALASVLGGVQSMFTAAWDEPFALPSEGSAMEALRTQQILAYETGVANTVDPLGGSWFVEALTDQTEEGVIQIMEDIEHKGGMVKAIQDGYVQGLIADEAWKNQRLLETGGRAIVGVSVFKDEEKMPDMEVYGLNEEDLELQKERVREVRRMRDSRAASSALRALKADAMVADCNLMPRLVDAVEAYATVGEITRELRDVWGEYQQPVVI
ncbi:MAG: methylmalonyl-CoA mutase family protein [Acidimicrobiales bacterium]